MHFQKKVDNNILNRLKQKIFYSFMKPKEDKGKVQLGLTFIEKVVDTKFNRV